MLGNRAAASAYRNRASKVRKAVHATFFNSNDNSYVNGYPSYLAIALICAAIYFMMNFCILVPLPMIYNGKFMTQLMCLIPILSGFFMFESLFSGRPSANTDQ